jgi:hypothetical protein
MKRFGWLLGALLAPSAVLALGTQRFALGPGDTFDKGKLDGAAVTGSGRVVRAASTTRTPLDTAAVAFASVEASDGAIYVGSGTDGSVLRVSDGKSRVHARLDAALVTSLAARGSELFAGTAPGGRVFAIDVQGKARELVRLAGAEYVWALAYDAAHGTLYAGTGPNGKVFAIDAQGKARELHDDDAEHVLALGLAKDGALYAGTSNGARLLRLAAGDVKLVYDADAQEISALSVGARGVAIAANDFPEAPPVVPDGARDATAAGRARRPKPGKGRVLEVGFDGRARELFQSDVGHVSALDYEPDGGALQLGLGAEGHVYRVRAPGDRARWADADERQIAALHLGGKHPHFLTSDGVALYTLGPVSARGTWTSAPLDAKSQARFGELRARSAGKVTLATRTGNSDPPGKDWSPWSAELTRGGTIASPPARYLQVRATLEGDAELYAADAYYVAQNLAPVVRNVRADRVDAKPGAPLGTLTLRWDVDNPDQDRVRYRAWFRREEQNQGVPLTRPDDVLERTELVWDTSLIPDGFYRVEVEASDELTTPAGEVERTRALSAPLLIDHRAPEIDAFAIDAQRRVSARAHDSLGPIVRFELVIDGAPAVPVAALDGVLDEPAEELATTIAALAPGAHLVTLRAYDAAENVSTKTIEVVAR